MSTLINRFFAKNEPVPSELSQNKDIKILFLDYLLEKGTSSVRLNHIIKEIDQHVFSEDSYTAGLQLVQRYLAIEKYLIYHDSKYIGSETKLREEIKNQFPELANSDAFIPIYAEVKIQEIILTNYFLKYVLGVFSAKNKSQHLATVWLTSLEAQNLPETDVKLVERINFLRRQKERSHEFYNEFVSFFGAEWVDPIYYKCFRDFSLYYQSLKCIKIIKDILPPNTQDATKKFEDKVIKLHEINGHTKNEESAPVLNQKSVLENILDGYILFDSKARVIDQNTNALKIFKIQEDEFKKTSLYSLLPKEISDKLNADIQNTNPLVQNEIIGTRQEVQLETKSGELGDYELTITNNYSEGADTYSAFFKNISNKKDTLKAISEAKVNAERMALAKSTFLSNMSHEIRTPLNVILGLSEIVSKSDLKDEGLLRKNLDGIDFSAKNLLSIVNDILDFSKIEAGKLSIQAIDFNLKDVVENLSNGFAIKAQEKGLDLEATIEDDIPDIVVGDQYRLNQILTNLIGNAIKFTQSGKVTINVQLVSENNEDIAVKFQVKDTGIGIEKDKLESIFDSFYQVESPENSKIIGTGLGLAITKELIQLQNGILHADSLLGMGSVFEFVLPLKKSKLKKISNSEKYIKRHDEKLKGLKVLVAEDNQMNQFYIKQLLGGLGVKVDIAENGADSVEKFNDPDSNYDLILMDMHMPVMNGIEAISTIRQSNKDSLKKVPIVACSADVFPEARKNAIKAGIDFYLTKPLNEEALKEVLFWLISDDEFELQSQPNGGANQLNNGSFKSKNVDINKLKETFDNDEEFIASLLEIFIRETPEEYKSLRNCVEREFYSRASSLAHKMKSSFMNLGMTLHGHHLQQIESSILKKETLADAKKHMDAFNKLYTKTLLEVNLLLIELRQH